MAIDMVTLQPALDPWFTHGFQGYVAAALQANAGIHNKTRNHCSVTKKLSVYHDHYTLFTTP